MVELFLLRAVIMHTHPKMGVVFFPFASPHPRPSTNKQKNHLKMSFVSSIYDGAQNAGNHILRNIASFAVIAFLFVVLAPGHFLNVPGGKDCQDREAGWIVGEKRIPPTMTTSLVHSIVFIALLALLFVTNPGGVFSGLVTSK